MTNATPERADEKPEEAHAEAAPAAEQPAPSTGRGLNYVFKIAPADPKNSLEFEDVADK